MEKRFGSIEYDGDAYATLEVKIDGAYNYYAEEGLCDAIEANNEVGCNLDNQIVFYPTREMLDEMLVFVQNDDYDGLKKYLAKNEIYYYKLVKGKLEGGL